MMLVLTLIVPSIITILCWFGVVANIKNEHHDTIFSNDWLFEPHHLKKPGLKYRLFLIVFPPIWFLLSCYGNSDNKCDTHG